MSCDLDLCYGTLKCRKRGSSHTVFASSEGKNESVEKRMRMGVFVCPFSNRANASYIAIW